MKYNIALLIIGTIAGMTHAQTTDKEFESLYRKVNAKKTNVTDAMLQDSSTQLYRGMANETWRLLDHLYDFMNEEHKLNGRGFFSFSGNETKNTGIYRVGTGFSLDQGLYPYELDFSANIQSLISNGGFVENESNIDISFDFHPIVPNAYAKIEKYEAKLAELKSSKALTETEKENNEYLKNKYAKKIESAFDANGLWLENYIIAQRFSEGYLGIENRYEFGGGFIFSFYSKALTPTGKKNNLELSRKTIIQNEEKDLIQVLKKTNANNLILPLSSDDIRIIGDSRSRYLISNRKQYSKLKLSFLIGAFYELEKTIINTTVPFNGKDSSFVFDIKPTNLFKAVIRPGIVWKPKDKYRLLIYPHFLFPFCGCCRSSPKCRTRLPRRPSQHRNDNGLD